jgi:hypothetical protein
VILKEMRIHFYEEDSLTMHIGVCGDSWWCCVHRIPSCSTGTKQQFQNE